MNEHGSRVDELQERLIAFAVSIVEIASQLPRTHSGRHVYKQIIRSGSATAANYGEARAAESKSDFIHKLRIVLKELNETAVWLQIITRCSLVRQEKVVAIVAENQELPDHWSIGANRTKLGIAVRNYWSTQSEL